MNHDVVERVVNAMLAYRKAMNDFDKSPAVQFHYLDGTQTEEEKEKARRYSIMIDAREKWNQSKNALSSATSKTKNWVDALMTINTATMEYLKYPLDEWQVLKLIQMQKERGVELIAIRAIKQYADEHDYKDASDECLSIINRIVAERESKLTEKEVYILAETIVKDWVTKLNNDTVITDDDINRMRVIDE